MALAGCENPTRREYDFRCLDCGRTTRRRMTAHRFLDFKHPACACGSTRVRRYVSPGLSSGQATLATNAKSKFDSRYPYASMRLPKRMKGLPHADGKTVYGQDDYVAGPGTTIVPDARTERELMAGQFNGERYGRE